MTIMIQRNIQPSVQVDNTQDNKKQRRQERQRNTHRRDLKQQQTRRQRSDRVWKILLYHGEGDQRAILETCSCIIVSDPLIMVSS